METKPLPEAEKEPSIKKAPKELSRIQQWTRTAAVGLLLPLVGATITTASFERSHHPVAPVSASDPEATAIPGTLNEERASNPNLTEDAYLDLLASRLTTPELLDRFFREKLEHMDDDVGQRIFFLIEKKNDYWQTPAETVRRVQRVTRREIDRTDGIKVVKRDVLVMRGDCEDYAFLAQEVLWRQGKVSHTVSIPENTEENHALCVWIERRPDGRFDGYTLDQSGVTRNGTFISHSLQRSTKRGDDEGFDSLQKAFNAAVSYPGNPESYDSNSLFIPILRVRGSVPYKDAVTIHAFDPDAPHLPSYLDFLIAMGISATTYGTYRFTQRRKEGETWKEYFTKFRLV
ncbi:hypothetical protein HYZ98_03900 [Candidatus Peregrinibacteria bacterium]|nr:hypothetical protein [Candidatus Peregrinibacteria bacterium]